MVAHHRGQYGLKGSGWTTKELPLPVKRQLVLDKMAKDPTSRKGPKTIIEGIGLTQGIHLTQYDASLENLFAFFFLHSYSPLTVSLFI